MSKEYDFYINDHRHHVRHAYNWMLRFLDRDIINKAECSAFEYGTSMLTLINDHDASKFLNDEYVPYDTYFYGDINLRNSEMNINKYITSINNQAFKPGKNTSAATGFIKSPGNSGR